MTQQEILDYNKRCVEFLFPNAIEEYKSGDISLEDGLFKKGMLIFGHFEMMKYHSDWNWIHEVIEAIEKLGSYTVMKRKIYGEFKISRYSVSFYFSPNQNFLLQLELKPFIVDEPWKHPMYKNHIIKEFDFKNKSKKEAVVQAINQFLIWYKENKK